MKNKRALMVAGIALATAWSTSAFAADPIKLSVGGYGAVMVGYASQDDTFLEATGTEVNAVDVKGDNEIHFDGSTTLDNGLEVTVHYEFEAGGRSTDDVPDIWNIAIGGEFGTVIAGADGSILPAVATGAPRVGGRLFNGGLGEGDLIGGAYVLQPAGFDAPDAAFINSAGDGESISYVSPSLNGFTIGATYMPDTDNEDNTAWPGNGGAENYGVGAQWVGDLGPVGLHVEGGWQTTDVSAVGEDLDEYQTGATLSVGGFSFGGAYKWADHETPNGDTDDRAWEVGAAYEAGPYGVSLGYLQTTKENTGTTGDNEAKVLELAGQYNLGPGIDLVGGIGYVSFENGLDGTETATQRNAAENDGFVVATGLSLAF